MPTYVIGDLQGCHVALQKLLATISFNPAIDRIWLVGDLVNRGVASADVLRWAMNMGDALVAVLGNHDLHTLAVAAGYVAHAPQRHHTGHPGCPGPGGVVDLAAFRPLVHFERDHLMVHAGLLPQWTVQQAVSLASEVESALQGPDWQNFLQHMYGNEPRFWHEGLHGMSRLRLITNAMTRLRFCSPTGDIEFAHKGQPGSQPKPLLPWFEVPDRASRDVTILFGHWSALGFMVSSNVVALDSGCLWSGQLTALRLEDHRVFQVSCEGLPGSKRWK